MEMGAVHAGDYMVISALFIPNLFSVYSKLLFVCVFLFLILFASGL